MKVKLTNLQSVAFDHSAISSIRYETLIIRKSKKDYATFSKEKKNCSNNPTNGRTKKK
jgi:hypothetical protein